MSENELREVKRLLLEQGVKIEKLAMEIRALKKAVETTEVVYLGPEDVSEPIDMPDDIQKLLRG